MACDKGQMTIGHLCGQGEDAIDVIITVDYCVSGKYHAGDYYNPPEYPEYEFSFVSARVDGEGFPPLTQAEIDECEAWIDSDDGHNALCEKYDDTLLEYGDDDRHDD